MKYIKKYETWGPVDMSFLKDFKRYMLLLSINENYIIVENYINQLRKLYDINVDNEFHAFKFHPSSFYYFTLNNDDFERALIYQSDSCSEIKENLEFYISTKKYNL
jgi:hypothetical protein